MSYCCTQIPSEDGIEFLKQVFPDGQADELNFVLFSTSGIHGSYMTIEDVEEYMKRPDSFGIGAITFIVCKPRVLSFHYCEATVTLSDIPYLKKLRKTSHEAVSRIGI